MDLYMRQFPELKPADLDVLSARFAKVLQRFSNLRAVKLKENLFTIE